MLAELRGCTQTLQRVCAVYISTLTAALTLIMRPHDALRLHVEGLVDRPVALSMDEILRLPSVTLPVTLVCSGNRCVGE